MEARQDPSPAIESVRLHCDEPPSDKFYNMRLVRTPGGFIVEYENGRRGRKGQSGTKPAQPTTYEKAKAKFDEALRQKVNRRRYKVLEYRPNTRGDAPAVPDLLSEEDPSLRGVALPGALFDPEPVPRPPKVRLPSTGYSPQLLNPIDDSTCEECLRDPRFYAQQKFDGVRHLLGVENGSIVASNRRSEGTEVLEGLASAFKELLAATGSAGGLCLDGERVGETFYAFDIHEYKGLKLARTPLDKRLHILANIQEALTCWRRSRRLAAESAIRFVPTARTEREKRALLRDLKESSAEGIVFKHAAAGIVKGRPTGGGGGQYKYKLVKTADCIISLGNAGGMSCQVYHHGRPVEIFGQPSGITRPIYELITKRKAGGRGIVAEIRYLYLTRPIEERGRLSQAVFLRLRDDKEPEECTSDQLQTTNRDIFADVTAIAA